MESKKLKPIKDDELNPRWAKFVELYLGSGNAKQSAIEAGFSEEYAAVITTRFPEKVRISLSRALEDKGIDSASIAEKVKWLMDQEDYQAVDKGISHAIKIRGDYSESEDKPKSTNIYNFIFTPESQAAIKEMEIKIKERLINAKAT